MSRRPPITPHSARSKSGHQSLPSSRASNSAGDFIRGPASSSARARQPQTPLRTSTLPGEDVSERFEDDDLGHIIAAIDMKDYGTVGCAYYSTEEEKLYLLGDSRSGGKETIEACMICDSSPDASRSALTSSVILQVKPTVILVPPRVDLNMQGPGQNLAQENGIV